MDRFNYDPATHKRKSIRLKGYDYSKEGLYFITICSHQKKCLFGDIVGAPLTGARATMQLNEFGQIADSEWFKLAQRFPNCKLDILQVMPNHLHGIIELLDTSNIGVADIAGRIAVNPASGNIASDSNRAGVNPVFSNIALDSNRAGVNPASGNIALDSNRAGVNPASGNIALDSNRAGVNPAPTVSALGNIIGAYKSLVYKNCLELCQLKNETLSKIWQRNFHEHIIRNEESYHQIADYIFNNPAKWNEDKFYSKKNDKLI